MIEKTRKHLHRCVRARAVCFVVATTTFVSRLLFSSLLDRFMRGGGVRANGLKDLFVDSFNRPTLQRLSVMK